ncbi:RagB/SusD family nutrient uptake outer membrane protein [Salegentibacter sp. T436]|uniref:RagB/SusD family nutrient uptake outer membrane protein n=1 Tax=Salegentibacter sp. T436 TaxID=1729720 RepID=UPI00094A7CEC|nr:RagB/SusD family nutrient uptake outer membrane protein [Salegentibacter sp. T436]APS40554.1 hypothetical protein AO058_17465 [Salegentibacter sp. T436]
MKKNILVIFLSVIILGCSEDMDFPTEASMPAEEFFETAEDAVQASTAIYAEMRVWVHVESPLIATGELASDNLEKGSCVGCFTEWFNYKNFTVSPDDGLLDAHWRACYWAINMCNQVTTNVPDIDMDPTLRNRVIGEAKVWRAWNYFDLYRIWGGVPIVNQIPVGPEANIRTTKEETLEFVIQDLREAADLLPDFHDTANLGRVTKWSAMGLLAKALMYQENWEEAKAVTDEIINKGVSMKGVPLDLHPNFYEQFKEEQEYNEESLLEVPASAIPNNPDISNNFSSNLQGVLDQWGQGAMVPSDNLANAFDEAGDSIRKAVTIIYRGEVTPDGDTVQGAERLDGIDGTPRYNGKAYVPTPNRFDGLGNFGPQRNIRLLRFAEILLINAEAALHVGGDAATPLNRVRERVDLPPIENPTFEDIWFERRLELAGEQDRFYDLVRTGRANEVLAPQGFEAGKNELYPIPAEQIRQTDYEMEQNPGY